MARKKRVASQKKIRRVPTSCPFCREKRPPDYKEAGELSYYLSGRARILPRSRTGVCAKHQRDLSRAIKRARTLALLPFEASTKT